MFAFEAHSQTEYLPAHFSQPIRLLRRARCRLGTCLPRLPLTAKQPHSQCPASRVFRQPFLAPAAADGTRQRRRFCPPVLSVAAAARRLYFRHTKGAPAQKPPANPTPSDNQRLQPMRGACVLECLATGPPLNPPHLQTSDDLNSFAPFD